MQKVVTHSGSFHADDVFAVATLQLHLGVDNIEVIRTRDEQIISEGDIVVDVGGIYDPEAERFDHHQVGVVTRDNGISYAAFGLVWKKYGEEVSGSKEVADHIEEKLVLPIDAVDNGVSLYNLTELEVIPITVHSIFGLLQPEWGSDSSIDDAFMEACTLARKIIKRAITHSKAGLKEEKVAIEAYNSSEDKRVIISDQPISSRYFVDYEEPLFLVSPRDTEPDSNWKVSAVRVSHDGFEVRRPFPEEWAGLRGEELVAVSGIEGAVFCHKGGFLFVADNKEGAMAAVEKNLNK